METMQKGIGKGAVVVVFQLQLHSPNDLVEDGGGGFCFHSLCCLFTAAFKSGSNWGKSS